LLVYSTGMKSLLSPWLQNIYFSPFLWIPVHSSGFRCHSCGFHWIPVEWLHSCRNQWGKAKYCIGGSQHPTSPPIGGETCPLKVLQSPRDQMQWYDLIAYEDSQQFWFQPDGSDPQYYYMITLWKRLVMSGLSCLVTFNL